MDVQFVSSNQILVKGHEKFAEVMSVSIPRFEMEFERRFLLLLVLHDNFLTIQEIADELLVSKSYAEKHLAAIMEKVSGRYSGTAALWYPLCSIPE